MITAAPKLTDVGKSLLIRGIGGERITFTKFRIGNGELDGRNEVDLTDIINPVLEFGVSSINAYDEGYVDLTGNFDSGDITSDFRWTELGVFAKGEDGKELLYAYVNDSEHAGMLKANTTDVVIEQSVSIIVAVGTAQNVTALVTPSVLYAPKDAFDQHVQNFTNPHKVTAEMLGLGNVPNVGTNDQTPTFSVPTSTATQELVSGEKISVLFGKIARAIMNLISHLANKNNPHAVTADQAGAAKKQHTHGAADINSGVLGIPRGGTGVTSVEELRAFLGSGIVSGMYYGNNAAKRHIELGFKPVAVLLMNQNGMPGDDIDGVCGGLCVGEYGLVSRSCSVQGHETAWNSGHTAMLISDTGFWVGYNSSAKVATNASGDSYRYIAWR